MATSKVSELTELTSADNADLLLIADTSAGQSKKIQKSNITEQNFTTTLKNKLDAIEASADVTDTTNVVAALTAGTNITIAADGTISATDTDTGILNVVEDTTPQLGGDLDTNGNNINFGDSAVAGTDDTLSFGASNNLQIYATSANSYITEKGTGSLFIQGSNDIYLRSADGSEYLADFKTNSGVDLYYDNSKKFQTTSTGVDVTGTVTADGLTVDGGTTTTLTLNGNRNDIVFTEGDTTDLNTLVRHQTGLYRVDTINDALSSIKRRFSIDHATGDISFYENTGTTAKLFWDASAEELGIGTTSPSSKLHINGGSENVVLQATNSTNTSGLFVGVRNSSYGSIFSAGDGYIYQGGGKNLSMNADGGGVVRFGTNASERMRIDSSGNVGIGTSSPIDKLHVAGDIRTESTTPVIVWKDTTDSSEWSIDVGSNKMGIYSSTLADHVLRADSSGNVGIGTGSPTTKLDVSGTITATNARSADVVDNDGSFDLDAGTNFTCTPTGNITLTFTNIPDGQSGTIVLVNTGGHTISAASTTKVMGADMLTTITTAGTYVIGYISDGTNVRVYNSLAQQ